MTILEPMLADQEAKVDALLKAAGRYVSSLKAWKKACMVGPLANRHKAANQALEAVTNLPDSAIAAVDSWQFNAAEYYQSADWQSELQAAAAAIGLRVFTEADTIVSSPVIVRAQPARGTLVLGKVIWPNVHPLARALELKRLREQTNSSNSQEFVDSLCAAAVFVPDPGSPTVKFKDLYNLFAMTPGWKKDNPRAAFGLAIYALQSSEIRATRSGRSFEIVTPSGKYKEGDIFSIIAEDGKPLRYYGIRFK